MAAREHILADDLPPTRREVLGSAAGALALGAVALPAETADAVGEIGTSKPPVSTPMPSYLTPMDRFGGLVREKPAPYSLSPEKLREIGLDRQTWQLEIIPEEGGDSKVEHPLSKAAGTALDFAGLMKLAEKSAVRFIVTLTCTNVDEPFGTGLWEGVPLREVIWLARPKANIRRVYYYGFHNDQPKQRFQSSLAMSRVLEDPPGELTVILCYKYNGRWLSPKLGGPVRLVVPGAYGNKSVKWLQQIVLSNNYQANDTYATWNNDTESPMKSEARFLRPPTKAKAGQAMALAGFAQVGMGGLSKVQYALHAQNAPLPGDDPYLTMLAWQDAQILPAPENWGGDLLDGKLPPVPLQFDPATGKPQYWPLRYATAYWTATVTVPAPGRYFLRCRAIDANGIAQPLPRPLPKSGNNVIQKVELVVEA